METKYACSYAVPVMTVQFNYDRNAMGNAHNGGYRVRTALYTG